MTAIYEIELWKVILPWCLFAIAVIGNVVGWWIAWVLHRSNSHSQSTIISAQETVKVLKARTEKAEAESRESTAAHQEAVRKLSACALRLAEAEHELSRLNPIRGKNGQFVGKKGGNDVTKKVSKSRAK